MPDEGDRLSFDGDVGEAEGVVGAGGAFGGFEVEGGGVLSGVGPHHCQGGGVAVSELVVGGDLAQGVVGPLGGGVVDRVVARLGGQQAQPCDRAQQLGVLLTTGASGQLGRLQPVGGAGLGASGAAGGLDLTDEVLAAAGNLFEHEGQLVVPAASFDRDSLAALGDRALGLGKIAASFT